MAMYYFLLVYDRRRGSLLTVQRFEGQEDAARAYGAVERAAQEREDLEIVLIGADSIDTIKQTHGQYFPAHSGASKYLEPVTVHDGDAAGATDEFEVIRPA